MLSKILLSSMHLGRHVIIRVNSGGFMAMRNSEQ